MFMYWSELGMGRSCVGLQTGVVLLLLLLRQSVAMAPGDEDERCPIPEYPVNVRVLMDSWRYQTLLGEDGVWTATTDQRHQMTVAMYSCSYNALTFIYMYSGLLKEHVGRVQCQYVLEVNLENGW